MKVRNKYRFSVEDLEESLWKCTELNFPPGFTFASKTVIAQHSLLSSGATRNQQQVGIVKLTSAKVISSLLVCLVLVYFFFLIRHLGLAWETHLKLERDSCPHVSPQVLSNTNLRAWCFLLRVIPQGAKHRVWQIWDLLSLLKFGVILSLHCWSL